MIPLLLLLALGAPPELDDAAKALREFHPVEALELLVPLSVKGGQPYADRVRTYELMGVSYAYLEQSEAARDAFSMLLALDPVHVIPCTLGPKVTFLFDEARRAAGTSSRTAMQLQWPRGLMVSDALPVTIETVADGRGLLKRAELRSRRKSEPDFSTQSLTLPPAGAYTQVLLPPTTTVPTGPETVQLYLVAQDDRANETFMLGSPEAPFEVNLGYAPPPPWYGRWWVWAIAGTALVAGATATVYALTRPSPNTASGNLVIGPAGP